MTNEELEQCKAVIIYFLESKGTPTRWCDWGEFIKLYPEIGEAWKTYQEESEASYQKFKHKVDSL